MAVWAMTRKAGCFACLQASSTARSTAAQPSPGNRKIPT
nr:MAG TPA: hypothetical protein [Caudoviricetes sp.]